MAKVLAKTASSSLFALLLFTFIATACQGLPQLEVESNQSVSPEPNNPPGAALTQEVTASATPSPSATPLSLPVIENTKLREASLRYLADTEQEAVEVAKSLSYLDGDGHPSNMCGPLALAIMRDAGLVPPDTVLHDFWLLNPRYNQNLLEQTFPRDRYLWYRTTTPTHQFDFQAFPLEAGDLLYLYAEPGGSFEHILVVTRVDSDGKAYTVTNRNTEDGYQIHELMLYDPNNPGEGLFFEWTDWKNVYLGLTGFGGFDLWRPRREPGGSPQEQLAATIDQVTLTYGGDWQILIRKMDGVILYTREADRLVHIASVIKIPIALLFMKSLEIQSPPDLQQYLENFGVDERSYQQLLRASLVVSEESATDSLASVIKRNGLNAEAVLQEWGLANTSIKTRMSTASDMARLLESLYDGKILTPEARELILELMNEYTPNDDSRLGFIQSQVPGVTVYNKRGTLTDEFLVVADVALVIHNENVYSVILLSRQASQNHTTYELLEVAAGEIAGAFSRYLMACSSQPETCP